MKRLINFWNHYFKYQRVLIEVKEYKKFSKKEKEKKKKGWSLFYW